jgi:hypothetical protein
MKLLVIAFCLLMLASFPTRSAFACTCMELKNVTFTNVGPPPTPDEIKKWRAEETDSALFIGRVIKIDTIHVKQSVDSIDKSPMKKVTVAVESYWLGVKQGKMTIYTGVGHGDCGVHYSKGKLYFFWAARDPVTDFLETNICGPTTVDPKLVADLDEVFGRAKSFP